MRRSDEAFNAGKEIEAMKRLMLHRIASSLLLPSFGYPQNVVFSYFLITTLTLIRAAGGVYDFRNFEQV